MEEELYSKMADCCNDEKFNEFFEYYTTKCDNCGYEGTFNSNLDILFTYVRCHNPVYYKQRFPITYRCPKCGIEINGYTLTEMCNHKNKFTPLYHKHSYKFADDVLKIFTFDIDEYIKEMHFCLDQLKEYKDISDVDREVIEDHMLNHLNYVLTDYFKTRNKRNRSKYIDKPHTNCIFCNSREKLEYHHVIPFEYGGSSDLSNIISICNSCHNKLHYLQDIALKHVIKITKQAERQVIKSN